MQARRFHSLDALRGLAALAVVLWHWQHFGAPRAASPLYSILWPFYAHGGGAVELFFCLSGFLFTWKYRDAIARGLSPWRFFVLRFSRIYPLHLLTLLTVLLLHRFLATPLNIYGHGDGYHLALNTLLAQGWGLEQGYSFNGPAWSISVEEACYALFFVLCAFRLHRPLVLLGLIVTGHFLLGTGSDLLGRGLLSFFAGALVHWVYERAARPDVSPFCLHAGAAGLAFALFSVTYWPTPHPWELVYFPALVLSLALFDHWLPARRLTWLGNISYSVYLWHYPLQILFWQAALALGLSSSAFTDPVLLVLFFGTLIPLAFLSFHYFEAPVRRGLRSLLLGPA